MLAVSSVTMNVTNGGSGLCDILLQELPTWEIVHLQLSERLFVGALSHEMQKTKATCFYLLDGYFLTLKGVATSSTRL